ncbi:MAG: TlpA family protein disulfide reductase [Flavobacteriaceae bacterium]|nr:TlpA family protein disulfide reductase [Flavobacteriaceae bacterium]
MKYIMTLLILVLFSCQNDIKTKASLANETSNEEDFELEIYDFDGLEPFLTKKDNKTYVVNFWATWCAPCIKEMPHFEKLNTNYKHKNVEVLLVSLDFPFNYEKKLKPFIKKHKLQSKVIALDDPDMNTWIPKIDKNWDGTIPVTIIYNKSKRIFYNQTFTYNQLEEELQKFLN